MTDVHMEDIMYWNAGTSSMWETLEQAYLFKAMEIKDVGMWASTWGAPGSDNTHSGSVLGARVSRGESCIQGITLTHERV